MIIEIEYKNKDNEYDYIDVDLIPSFETEYTQDDEAYLICENIEWNKSNFTQEQNEMIGKYILDNYEKLDKMLCDSWLDND